MLKTKIKEKTMGIYSVSEIQKMPEPKRTEEMKKKYEELYYMAHLLAEDQGCTGKLFYKTFKEEHNNKKENNVKK